MVRIKICGITSHDDACTAIACGADALGFVFHGPSPRNLSPDVAADIISSLPPFVQTVGLFVNEKPAAVNRIADRCGLDVVQLHGEESPEECAAVNRRVIKAFRVRDSSVLENILYYPVAACLLDAWSPVAHGGTGTTFNWDIAADAVRRGHRIILAGGLTPDNIAAAVQTVAPYGIDVSSGVETAPGIKDPTRIRDFIARARCTEAQCSI